MTLVVLGLGVFGIATGLLLRFYAYPALAKIPHDPKTSAVAQGSGITALVYVEKKGSPTQPEIQRNLNLTSSTYVSGDARAPEVKADGGVTSWIEATRVTNDRDGKEINASVRELCLDRFSAEAVAPCTNQYLQKTKEEGKDTRIPGTRGQAQFPGLNFKFPFQTEKRTYPWYDTGVNKQVDAKFDGEDEVDGLPVYRFKVSVPPTDVDGREVPGSLVGKPDASVSVRLHYQVDKTMWVEPDTGALVKVRQSVKQELRTSDQGAGRGTAVFDGTLELNRKTVENNVRAAEANKSRLWLLTGLPVVLWIAGGVLLLAGIALLLVGRRRA
ncbi:DUF3068 domain-containing protein [Umezawaea endophytica]|uniref:DUF3068 domain-containing protein n=1 Tax=Umezawaea endophytica TaxID=1654476 RepID=A0A9X3AFY7_9PSEU|nr:DUF3068 domain-containing protein [Umezawaea endophytica]MCS7477795.1 DUF3068 domain-containing protein [Umezawaea endophytica]